MFDSSLKQNFVSDRKWPSISAVLFLQLLPLFCLFSCNYPSTSDSPQSGSGERQLQSSGAQNFGGLTTLNNPVVNANPPEMTPFGIVNTNPSGKNELIGVPVRIIFLSEAQNPLTTQPQLFANEIIEKLNEKMEFNSTTKMMHFALDSYDQVVDQEFVYASCSDIDAIGEKYFQQGVLTIVVNDNLDGPCAGVTYLHADVGQRESVILVEKDYALYAAVHEFGHVVGLPHTGVSTTNSGLHKFSDLLAQNSSSQLRCDKDFYYFIDSQYNNKDAMVNGIIFNSSDNIMYFSFNHTSYANSFFTSGYDYSFSWAFHCWHKLNKGLFRYSQTLSGI